MYALIGLSLVLLGVAGLQFTYMFYIDRVYQERRKYLQALEQKCAVLKSKLDAAELQIAQQDRMIATFGTQAKDDEVWADVIGDS